MLEAFLKGLQQPEYVHVLLNPLPVYGVALGLAALTIALTLRSRRARICSLMLILHCGKLGLAGDALRAPGIQPCENHD